MSEDATAAPPALFEHMCTVYNAMDVGSSVEELDEENEEIKVYEGHLTGLFQKLSMPVPYYTSIMKALKAMGCVEQLRRGGGAATSKWQLCYPPTLEGYLAYENNKTPNRRAGQVAALEQQVRQLRKRVEEIAATIGLPAA